MGVYKDKVGMWIGWLHELGGKGGAEAAWPTEWRMRWGVAPLPSDGQLTMPTLAYGYFVSAQTQNPEACWQWIAFLSAQEMHSQLMPARRSVAESGTYEQVVGRDVAVAARASMENAILIPEVDELQESLGIFGNALDKVLDDSATPAEAMTQAQQQAEQ